MLSYFSHEHPIIGHTTPPNWYIYLVLQIQNAKSICGGCKRERQEGNTVRTKRILTALAEVISLGTEAGN